jgi:hypothetical protein
VNDAGIVCFPERLADLDEDARDLRRRQPPEPRESPTEILAAQQLHDQVRRPILDAVVLDVHDVRALERSGGARLPLESLDERWCRSEAGIEEFHRQSGLELHVVRDPDGAHAALSERRFELVLSPRQRPFSRPFFRR